MSRIKKLLFFIKVTLVVGILFYVFRTLWINIEDVKTYDFKFNPYLLLLSFPFAVLYLVIRAHIWHLLIKHHDPQTVRTQNWLAWFSSIIGKYIPGKVFLLLGRLSFYEQSGISKSRVAIVFLLEQICATVAAGLIFLCSLGISSKLYKLNAYVPLVAGVAIMAVFVSPSAIQILINVIQKIRKRPPTGINVRSFDLVRWILLMMGNWLILGFGFYLLMASIFSIEIRHYFFVTGAFALAGIIGIFALFAPSGLGVRESVLLFCLPLIMNEGLAAAAAILSRVWITLAELICFGLALMFSSNLRKSRLPERVTLREKPLDNNNDDETNLYPGS